ncbi:MAG TPA: nucleotide pyrophosphohydrolase [Planctomycetaceae bacterium]|nr:nucleotide pyrophosphohydrolase [Planctomycetaceae bacterium]HIQ21053.1 nucleotide pyrophosphohydrolase [Planctomycetota bacterium]
MVGWAGQGRFSPTRERSEAVTEQPSSNVSTPAPRPPKITLAEFQELIRTMYLPKDVARGVDGTFMWFMEEVGELAGALRHGTREQQAEEFADVLAWLTTMANVVGVDLSEAVSRKYGSGCPGCGRFSCICPDAGKP